MLCLTAAKNFRLAVPNTPGSRKRRKEKAEPTRRKIIVRRTVWLALLYGLWSEEQGQDIAEYAIMLAVILVVVVGTLRLIGSNANNAFSSVASTLQ